MLVQDSYADGVGRLHGSVLGLVTVAKAGETPEMTRGELMRYLAEAPWYPTALLPSQGVRWEPISDSSARATLTDKDTSVAMEFEFNDTGLIHRVYAPARHRIVGNTLKETPWEGRFWSYLRVQGMLVPTKGEVGWVLPEGTLPYWRATVTPVSYEHA